MTNAENIYKAFGVQKAFEVDPKGTARKVPSADDKKKAEEERTSRIARRASKYLDETKGATDFKSMQKSVVSLQKFLDDCGCDD